MNKDIITVNANFEFSKKRLIGSTLALVVIGVGYLVVKKSN